MDIRMEGRRAFQGEAKKSCRHLLDASAIAIMLTGRFWLHLLSTRDILAIFMFLVVK